MSGHLHRSVEQFLYRKADLCDRQNWVDCRTWSRNDWTLDIGQRRRVRAGRMLLAG